MARERELWIPGEFTLQASHWKQRIGEVLDTPAHETTEYGDSITEFVVAVNGDKIKKLFFYQEYGKENVSAKVGDAHPGGWDSYCMMFEVIGYDADTTNNTLSLYGPEGVEKQMPTVVIQRDGVITVNHF